MADTTHWKLQFDADNVALLSLDKVGSSANTLGRAILQELEVRLGEIQSRRPRALIVTSAKKSGFIAGADIKEFTALATPAEAYELIRAGQIVMDHLQALPCPSVAALQGFALGGGLELALACTYRVGANDGKLSLGFPEVQLGIHPGFGGTVRAVRLIGVRPAMALMLTGKPIKGDEALAVGLLDRLVPAADLLAEAKQLVLSAPPRKSAPSAEKILNIGFVRPFVAKQLEARVSIKARRDHYPAPYAIIELWRRYGASGSASYEAEARSISALMCSQTSRNLVRVFLLQDRLKGLGGKSALTFAKAHVIGAGVMGGDIAAWCAFRGMRVTLQDRSEELVAPALARAKSYFDKRSKSPEDAAAALGRLRADVAGAGVADADVVIEAIFENADAKSDLYASLEPRMKAGAILASNTSSIMIETLSQRLPDPSTLVGIHFFNPVAQMQLVEIVRGADTREEIVQAAIAFTRRLDKLPLPCRSAPGFVVNRVLLPYMNEAIFALEDGIPIAAIDQAGVDFGMPMGPLELCDVVGLDVCLHVGEVLAKAFNRRVPQSLAALVQAKKLGRKSGAGFYVWSEGKPVRTVAAAAATTASADLQDRLMLPMVNEAVACLREKVIDDADLLDAGVIFGTGFAQFRGGPLQYAKTRSVADVRRRLEELARRYGERFKPDAGWSQLK